MSKKLIYLDEDKVKKDLRDANLFMDQMNRCYAILNEFGIDDPEAAKNPLDALHARLKEIVNTNDEQYSIDPAKAAEMIGKGEIYSELAGLNKVIMKSPFREMVRFNKKRFSLKAGVLKEIQELASVYITSLKQIELHNRLEAYIKEANDLSLELGERFRIILFNQLLNVFKVKKGEIVINHHIFLRETQHLDEGYEAKKPEVTKTKDRVSPFEKAICERELEAQGKIKEAEASLEEKNTSGDLNGIAKLKQEISVQKGKLIDLEKQRQFYGIKPRPDDKDQEALKAESKNTADVTVM